jgi:hypothetical protein
MFIVEDYTCINSASCWDCNIIFYLFIEQNYGPKKSVDNAPRRKLGSFATNFYSEITSWCIDLMTPEGIRKTQPGL